ncbi:kinase-like domain-containing protein [Mycena metata]|uniref:Kinase-like domain-containing protein n=1 Tax=Mycena metata TaxID=1033252 RepID=A0AAD7NHP4_9AGAR|nr:kinase-like domain-containing protein [Mycena metata]
MDEADEDLQQTQESTQETEDAPRQTQENTAHLWGFLTPCLSQSLVRRDLLKDEAEVKVGRNDSNAFVLPGYKISNFHAVIKWNGLENAESIVTIDDLSSNGTFINGEKIGRGQRRLLKDGNEVAFGAPSTSRENNGLFDYRYIFRDLVSHVPKRPVYQAYDLSVELGKGSFATVYKALHIASGEWVAVKVIRETKRTGGSNSANAQSREISVMEELKHPNICMLREVFWNPNGSIDLVLELITGGDLLDFILTRNGLDEPTAKHITYQLCQALAYIHGKGIAHRDLKPENVLLTSDTPPIVKVADFGLAKIVDSMTMLKTMCGTPSYLAPEVVTQTAGRAGYDSLVDSWSVGVILFSMLTNTTPFIDPSHEDLKVRIAERTIDWSQLEGEGMGLSAEVIDFIRNLLEFDPRRRMRLSSALSHPWLDGYADSVSQGIEHLRLNGSIPAVPPHTDTDTTAPNDGSKTPPSSSTPPGLMSLNRSGGRGRGVLQRRSEVIQHAVETGRPLVEPSWEMVSYATSGSGTNGKGPNKRVRAELTPLTEDGEDEDGDGHEYDGGTGASSPLSSVGETPPPRGPARKKSRASAQDAAASPVAPKGRRTAKGASAGTAAARKVRGKAGAVADGEGEEGQTPAGTRRSTRARSGKR